MPSYEHLHPDQFMEEFIPGEYHTEWTGVASNREFLKGKPIGDLIEDVDKRGVTRPVKVADGVVVDGHHRVIAAAVTGKPIPFHSLRNTKPYADQIDMVQAARYDGSPSWMPSAAEPDWEAVPDRLKKYLESQGE